MRDNVGKGLTHEVEATSVLNRLRSLADADTVKGMASFGINTKNALGVSMTAIRKLAGEIGREHELAIQLWRTGIHEARILAALVDDPGQVTEDQMERWVKDFDSWDVCDQVCGSLFDRTPMAYAKAIEWSAREEEYVRRAGFVLMATLSVHDKKADDGKFLQFLPIIKKRAEDERNYVKKAVNWALRQIGKRSIPLNAEALRAAEDILKMGAKSARWIASDAIRELDSGAVQDMIRKKERKSSGR